MSDFVLQFKPRLLKGGSSKVREAGGKKHYVAAFVQGRQLAHLSRVSWRTATDALLYSHQVVERYQRLSIVAFQQYLDAVNESEVEDAATS